MIPEEVSYPVFTAADAATAPAVRPKSLARRILANRTLCIGGGILLIIVLLALFAPWIVHYSPYDADLSYRNVPPVWYERGTWMHVLGTDPLGRDYLSRLLYGARISLLIGFSVPLIAGTIGTAIGVCAGYFGGTVDAVLSYIVTIRLTVPLILAALAVVAAVGGSLEILILVLGLLKWDYFAVVMRSATQQIRRQDYIVSAVAAGASRTRILLTEVLPNLLPQLIVIATLEVSNVVLLAAALSFLGLGVQPPLPDWGLMIAEAKTYMFFSFWLIAIPGSALALLSFSVNLAGDGLNRLLTPGENA